MKTTCLKGFLGIYICISSILSNYTYAHEEQPILSQNSSNLNAETEKQVPLLIPYDPTLFALYCQRQQDIQDQVWFNKIWTIGISCLSAQTLWNYLDYYRNKTAVTMSTLATVTSPQASLATQNVSMLSYAFSSIKTIFGSCLTYAPHAIVIVTALSSVIQGAICAKEFVTQGTLYAQQLYNNSSTTTQKPIWENLVFAPRIEQQKVWHEEIYRLFGSPVVEGSVPIVGKYILVFKLKYGAGQVTFDPFDTTQIRILLGINGSIHDDLRCESMQIIPIMTT
jgi:hypothetical protein